jgi:hypothetical protein
MLRGCDADPPHPPGPQPNPTGPPPHGLFPQAPDRHQCHVSTILHYYARTMTCMARTWRMAHGAWRMAHGAWHMAHGTCMARTAFFFIQRPGAPRRSIPSGVARKRAARRDGGLADARSRARGWDSRPPTTCLLPISFDKHQTRPRISKRDVAGFGLSRASGFGVEKTLNFQAKTGNKQAKTG